MNVKNHIIKETRIDYEQQGPLQADRDLNEIAAIIKKCVRDVYPLKRTLHQALDIIRSHHERINGSGYPDGLKGEAISMVARIIAVTDCYDALITDRPYRKAYNQEEVLRLMRQEAGEGKMDGPVVDTLIVMLNSQSKEGSPEGYY